MYNPDIQKLFGRVPVKTVVHLIHHSLKVGVDGRGNLFLEATHGIKEEEEQSELHQTELKHVLAPYLATMNINWPAAERAFANKRGIPVTIGHRKAEPQP